MGTATVVNVQKAIERQRELIQPSTPVDFIENVICCQAGDCLTAALADRPQERKLLNSMILGYLVQINTLKHHGLVERDLDEWIRDDIPGILTTMSALGFRW